MDNKPTTAELVVMGSGAAVFIGSFLHFYDGGGKAWDFFPALLVAIFGLLLAGAIAAQKFGNVKLGDGVGGFSWTTIDLMVAFYCAVLMVALLIEGTGGIGWGIGFWLMLIGGIGLFVGVVMLSQQRSGTARPGPTA